MKQGTLDMKLSEKYEILKENLRELGSLAIGFSGGVDSTFLLKVAHEVLGDRVLAITAVSGFIPQREREEAAVFCREEGIRQEILSVDWESIEGLRQNPKNRCYICKHAIFGGIRRIASANQIGYVAEGSNMDDLGDYRPGMKAIDELKIVSPLRDAALTKQEIRELSKRMNLPTWDKPSYACLASRFVYGEELSKEKLHMVEQAEDLLISMGFAQMRVRIHGMMARIEVNPEDFERIMEKKVREEIVERFSEYGFTYVSLDLKGFRSGSMNETIQKN